MHGGLIHVHGNAGHLIGSAYRGSKVGMTAGTILVDGSVGNEVGLTLRRGLVAIGGACGDFVGFNMAAGTVLIFGQCGNRPAAGMRRGTVGLFGGTPPTLLVSFRKSCVCKPLGATAAGSIFRQLQSLGFAVPSDCWSANYGLSTVITWPSAAAKDRFGRPRPVRVIFSPHDRCSADLQVRRPEGRPERPALTEAPTCCG